jgi:hypothetical protein
MAVLRRGLRAGSDPALKYQREIADAISDPEIERITMFKAARAAINNLLTGKARYRIVERAKAPYRET